MSLLMGSGALAEIKAKTDNLPADPASQALTASAAQGTAIDGQTSKLAGAAPVQGSTTAAWQTAEADVVSLGVAGARNKAHDLSLNVSTLAGTSITVRLYKKVNAVERKVYEQSFNAAVDPPGLPIINGAWAAHEAIRVTPEQQRRGQRQGGGLRLHAGGHVMSLLVIPRSVALLSELEIDADKDWQGFGITNLKELAAGMQAGDTIAFDGAGIVKLSPTSIGDELASGGAGHATTWKAPPTP